MGTRKPTNIQVYADMQAYAAQPELPMQSYDAYRDPVGAWSSAQGSFDAMREIGYPDCVVVAIIPTCGIVRWSADQPKGQWVKP